MRMNLLSNFPFPASLQAHPESGAGQEIKGFAGGDSFFEALMQAPAGSTEAVAIGSSSALVLPGDAGKALPQAGQTLPLPGKTATETAFSARQSEAADITRSPSIAPELLRAAEKQYPAAEPVDAGRPEAFAQRDPTQHLQADDSGQWSQRPENPMPPLSPGSAPARALNPEALAGPAFMPAEDTVLRDHVHVEAKLANPAAWPARAMAGRDGGQAGRSESADIIGLVRSIEVATASKHPVGTSIDDFPATKSGVSLLPGDAGKNSRGAAVDAQASARDIPVLRRKVGVAKAMPLVSENAGLKTPGPADVQIASEPRAAERPRVARPSLSSAISMAVQGSLGHGAALPRDAAGPIASKAANQGAAAPVSRNPVSGLIMQPPAADKETQQPSFEKVSQTAPVDKPTHQPGSDKPISQAPAVSGGGVAALRGLKDQAATSLSLQRTQLENQAGRMHDVQRPGNDVLQQSRDVTNLASNATRTPDPFNAATQSGLATTTRLSTAATAVAAGVPAATPISGPVAAHLPSAGAQKVQITIGGMESALAPFGEKNDLAPASAGQAATTRPGNAAKSAIAAASFGFTHEAGATEQSKVSFNSAAADRLGRGAGILTDHGNRIETVRIAGIEMVTAPQPGPGQSGTTDTSAPVYHLRAPMGTEKWAQSLGERVMLMVRGEQQIARLSMNPEHLGPLEIRLQVKDDQAQFWIHAQHQQARDAIDSAMPRLREMLAEQGLNLNRDGARDSNGEQSNNSSARSEPARRNWTQHSGDEHASEDRTFRGGHDGVIDHYA
ncbi:MAG: hypothetical protein HKN59_01055 [Gammaproteobacteria bacterium]|nr:hypothetical protein [Gammaproteobacteria bacterium]